MPEITITEKTISRPITITANPELPEISWRGLFADYRDMVANTTEAADAFHYATFLQVFGCTLGRRLFVYHARKLYPNFYTCLVGRSGITRKDTTWLRGRDVLDRLHLSPEDEGSPPFKVLRGIRSSEGVLDDLAGERKVRLIELGEFYSLLAKAKQESVANIIPALNELYDSSDVFNAQVRQKPIKPAKEPFLSITAGTTQDWLQKALTERDIYGGFANRWCYFYGLPKDPMPNPPKVDPEKRIKVVERLNEIRQWADGVPDGEITISSEAEALFERYYSQYYWRCQQPGLIPTLIVRVQDFIWKVALLYAADAMSKVISADHLELAIAVGGYLEAGVTEVFANFGQSQSKQKEMRIVEYVKSAGGLVPYRDVYRNLNLAAKELETTVEPLLRLGVLRNHYEGKKRMLQAT